MNWPESNGALPQRRVFSTPTNRKSAGLLRPPSFLDPLPVSARAEIIVPVVFPRRAGEHGVDEAVELHLGGVENFVVRILLQEKLHAPVQRGVMLQPVPVFALKRKARSQVLQHREAASPRAALLAHERLSVEQTEIILVS